MFTEMYSTIQQRMNCSLNAKINPDFTLTTLKLTGSHANAISCFEDGQVWHQLRHIFRYRYLRMEKILLINLNNFIHNKKDIIIIVNRTTINIVV